MAKFPFCPAGNSLLPPFVFARPHICELQECRIRQERQEHIPLDDLAIQGHQAMQVPFLSHLQNAHLNAIQRCASTPHASSSPALPVSPPQAPMVRKALSTQSEGCCTYAIGLQPLSKLFIIPTNKAFRSTLLKPHLLPSAPV